MNKRLMVSLLFALIAAAFSGCGKSATPNPVVPADSIVLAKGADIGWLSQMEHDGIKFYNNAGVEEDCIKILKDKGVNAIRLRAWVNPAAGWCSTADVVSQAVRAKNRGMRIMIDFHYSDTWADPGHQVKPQAWQSLPFTGLVTALSDYTKDVMTQLKQAGITPEWVQIGNETNDGMLWEEGRASVNMGRFATLIRAGYDAVKQVSNETKVVVHISNGSDNNLFRWIFDGLKNNGAQWDVIGLSLYPPANDWFNTAAACANNMNDMVSRYGSPIMLSEVGMPVDQPLPCKSFLKDMISKLRSLPAGKGLGVFYWEPECYNNWQGYTLGAFDAGGKPTIALDAFSE